MDLIVVLDFANLFFAGILAGMEIVIHYGLRKPAQSLDDRSQIELRQALVVRLRVLVPAFFVPTALSGFAVTLLSGATPAFWWRVGAMCALIVWIAIRVIGTVPINKATLAWDAGAPPRNLGLATVVDHAERFHIVGVWVSVLAFAFFLAALASER